MPIATAFAAGPRGQFLMARPQSFASKDDGSAWVEDLKITPTFSFAFYPRLRRDVGIASPGAQAVKQGRWNGLSVWEQRNAALVGTALGTGKQKNGKGREVIYLCLCEGYFFCRR